MLAKLKVVSVLESLPGVGKVRAKRHHVRSSTSPRAGACAVLGTNQRRLLLLDDSLPAEILPRRAARRSRPR